MRSMSLRTLILIASAGLIGPSALLAQEADREAPLEHFKERLAETGERLNLSEEQIERVAPILTEHFEAMAKVLADNGISLADQSGRTKRLGLLGMRSVGKQLDKVRAVTLGNLEGVLTPKQISEYKKIQAERKKELRKRIMGRR